MCCESPWPHVKWRPCVGEGRFALGASLPRPRPRPPNRGTGEGGGHGRDVWSAGNAGQLCLLGVWELRAAVMGRLVDY